MPRAMPHLRFPGVLLLVRRFCCAGGVWAGFANWCWLALPGMRSGRSPCTGAAGFDTGRWVSPAHASTTKPPPDWRDAGMGPMGRTTAAHARSGTVGKRLKDRNTGGEDRAGASHVSRGATRSEGPLGFPREGWGASVRCASRTRAGFFWSWKYLGVERRKEQQ